MLTSLRLYCKKNDDMMQACLLLCVGLASFASATEDRIIAVEELQASDVSRIKGGNDADKGAHPWQVTIRRRRFIGPSMHMCGGSIINSRWIVSAAHCFSHANPSSYIIVAGEHDFNRDEGTEQSFSVQKIIKHERYHVTVGSHDIAVLKINEEFKFNQYVAPIKLATPGQHGVTEGNSQLHCITSGWGNLAYKGSSPTILQALVMPLLPLRTCQDAYRWELEAYDVTEDMLCTGHIQGDKSPCHGDSGGPLACMIEDHWTLTGVVSWGKDCGVPGYPGLFARVSHFHDWILNKVASN